LRAFLPVGGLGSRMDKTAEVAARMDALYTSLVF